MPEKSGFFDSTADDIRAYPARDFAEYFARLLTNGVFNGGTNLEVTAAGNDANVRLNVGYAWINGYVYSVYDSPIMLSIEPASTMDRIDRVVLRLDTSIPIRAIRAIILQGAPNTNPTVPPLVRSGNIYDISLAQIRVKANSTIIQQSNITDERLDQNVCGLVNSLIRVDTATFQRQWDDFIKSIQDQGFATTDYVRQYVDNNTVRLMGGLPQGSDLNNVVKSGQYQLLAASSYTNIPPNMDWSVLEVATPGAYVIQTLTSVTSQLMMFRTRTETSNGWSTWRKILQQSDYDSLFQSVANGKNDIAAAIRDKGQNAQGSDSFQQLANSIRQISTGGRIYMSSYSKTDYFEPNVYNDGNTWLYVDIVTIPASRNFADLFSPGNNMLEVFLSRTVTTYTGDSKWAAFVLIDESGVVYTIKSVLASDVASISFNGLSIDRNQRRAKVYFNRNGNMVGDDYVFPGEFNLHGRIRLCGAGTFIGSNPLSYVTVGTREVLIVTT